MNSSKVSTAHLQRWAYIYVRQSTAAQVEHHRESTDRQYKLIGRARDLGWPKDRIKVVDTDLAKSANGMVDRNGFDTMFTDVALHNVGLILSIEVSRLARNNSDWYRLLDLCGVTDTLIGDEDGLYHPGLFNDRWLLGLKGTMAEAELHVIRARLNGGLRNKAARGERCLQVGGLRIDKAVAQAFLEAVTPAGMEAALRAEQQCEAEYQATIQQWQRQVERTEYEAQRAE